MKIDTFKLKDSISKNYNLLVSILNKYGFKSARISGDKIRCGYDSKSKGDAISIYKCDKRILAYSRFSANEHGDIIQLFIKKTGLPFKEVVELLYKYFKDGYDMSSLEGHSIDFIERFLEDMEDETIEYEILDEGFLGESIISTMLLEDMITPKTQELYKVWYSEFYNRICFNWRDISGNLVGVTGRINTSNENDYVSKYYPVLINFKKSLHLYGLYENIEHIEKERSVVIFEAEKSVQQCNSFDFYNSVAVGSSSISIAQLRILENIGVKKLIFAYDEGLDKLDEILEKIRFICDYLGFKFKLYAIKDTDNNIMKKGSKKSPSEFGRKNFNRLLKNYLVSF